MHVSEANGATLRNCRWNVPSAGRLWARVRLPVAAVSHSGPPVTRGAEGEQMEGRARNLPLSAPLQEWATPVGCVTARGYGKHGKKDDGPMVDE